ncbi:ferroxidase fet3 [Mortierella antarctica]|nr:ferroxidase fet3 [Mortierella antarctica]
MLLWTTGLSALSLLMGMAKAGVVTLDWNITYVMASPDGLFERQVIGINGQFPPPAIYLDLNDTLIIHAFNQLSEPTSLHAHGLFQTKNAQMDGPAMVTQCPIPVGGNFTYVIPIEQHGTYWIHGHHKGHYVDGLRAPLIIRNPQETYRYDGEYTLAFADWYHRQHKDLLKEFLSIFNPSGAEPVPQSGLINQQSNTEFHFEAGKTYRLRIINMSALAMFHFYIDGHDVDIIEVDGVEVERRTVKTFPISAAQRYSVLVTAKNETSVNYYVHGDMDRGMFDQVPSDLDLKVQGKLIYNNSTQMAPIETVEYWSSFDDGVELVPVERQTTAPANKRFVVTAAFALMDDYVNRAMFNEVTYVAPKVPSLYTAMSIGSEFANVSEVYGQYSNPMVVQSGDWVEIVINNDDKGTHPFHLHGHVFQVVGRTTDGLFDPSAGSYPYFETTNPLRRDTVVVPAGTSVAIRFQATNPGVWFFHCHIEWHLEAGLAMTLVEAPEVMPSVLTVDPRHYEHCEALGIPYRGNAAGHAGLDMTGANEGTVRLAPGRFKAKGVVALVCTVVAALVGLVAVVWYAQEDEDEAAEQMRRARLQKARDSE